MSLDDQQFHVEAIKTAILNQDSHYLGIKLPLPQKAGTLTQQVSYAKQKAETIYKTHFLKK